MARYFDIQSTVLIVVGYGILPEEEDRPIAYELKRLITTRGQGNQSAVVVTDMWVLNHEMAEFFPAIAIGGPGVNAFTAQIYEELPVALSQDQQLFVQMHSDHGKRAALWGMDYQATRKAVELFVKEGFLDRFLDLIRNRREQ